MSLRDAQKHFKISAGTLSHHINRKHMKKTGGQLTFSDHEENTFVQYIVKVSDWGFPFGVMEIRLLIKNYLDRAGRSVRKFKNNTPSKEWVRSFITRHAASLRVCAKT